MVLLMLGACSYRKRQMNIADKINPNPVVARKKDDVVRFDDLADDDISERDPIDALEIFEILRHLNDPEHPLTLEELDVMRVDNIHVDDENSTIKVFFTPTVPHCSMATLIGLCIRVKLLRSLPTRFKVDVYITPGAHASEAAVNKQLNDKERVAAALENDSLVSVVNQCIAKTDKLQTKQQ